MLTELIKSKHSSLKTIMSRSRCVNFEPFDQFVLALSKFEKCILKIVTEYIYTGNGFLKSRLFVPFD